MFYNCNLFDPLPTSLERHDRNVENHNHLDYDKVLFFKYFFIFQVFFYFYFVELSMSTTFENRLVFPFPQSRTTTTGGTEAPKVAYSSPK